MKCGDLISVHKVSPLVPVLYKTIPSDIFPLHFSKIHYFIILSMALQLFVGPWLLFQFLNLYTVVTTPWTGHQPVLRSLPTHRTTQTPNKRTQTSVPRVAFETTTPVFERAKTVHVLGTVLRGSVDFPLAGVHFFPMRKNTCVFMCLNSVRASLASLIINLGHPKSKRRQGWNQALVLRTWNDIGCSECRLIGLSFYRRNFLRKNCATCREKCRHAASHTDKSDKPAQWTPCIFLTNIMIWWLLGYITKVSCIGKGNKFDDPGIFEILLWIFRGGIEENHRQPHSL
jgi:hypothetical protein